MSKGASLEIKTYSYETPLYIAVEDSNVNLVSFLLENKADPNYKAYRPLIDKAAEKGNLDIVKALFEHGAKKADTAPLHYASANGHLQVVKYLVNTQGYDVNSLAHGRTPLDCAAGKHGNLPVIEFLVSKDANLTNKRSIFVYSATCAKDLEMVE